MESGDCFFFKYLFLVRGVLGVGELELGGWVCKFLNLFDDDDDLFGVMSFMYLDGSVL
jgi:hypothetical protein